MNENEGTGILTLYSDVRSIPVKWLWYPYIAIGKITLLQGDLGDGKSTMMMHLISEISTGGCYSRRECFRKTAACNLSMLGGWYCRHD